MTFVHFLQSKIESSAFIFKTKQNQIHLSELAGIKASSEVPGGDCVCNMTLGSMGTAEGSLGKETGCNIAVAQSD